VRQRMKEGETAHAQSIATATAAAAAAAAAAAVGGRGPLRAAAAVGLCWCCGTLGRALSLMMFSRRCRSCRHPANPLGAQGVSRPVQAGDGRGGTPEAQASPQQNIIGVGVLVSASTWLYPRWAMPRGTLVVAHVLTCNLHSHSPYWPKS